jgi:cytochrome c2
MDSFEWNKIIGAVLFTLLVAFGLSIFSEILFETEAPESPGYIIAVAEEGTAEEGGAAAEEEPIGVLLAAADPGAGEGSARKCAACHTFAAGEANKVGPNLWGVVARPIAAHEGYEYSDAMQAYAEEAETWSFDHLNAYLADPKGVVPGTKMAFAGLKDSGERANVIAYLRSLSDNPEPLSVATTAAAEPEGTTDVPPEDAAAAEEPAGEGEAPEAAPADAAETAETDAATAPPVSGEETAQTGMAPEHATTDQPEAGQQTAQTETAAEQRAAEQPGAEPPAAEQPAEQQLAQTEPAPEQPAADQPTAEAGAASAGGMADLIAAADATKGESFAKRCLACHSFEADGGNKVGPNLFGVVDRPIASVADFEYSEAMVAFSENHAKVWDFDTLSTYLADPKGVVPGTKMIFPGIKKEEDRANLLAYLATLK